MRSFFALLMAGAAVLAVPAMAQRQPTLDDRIGKVEKEVGALQRKVFPGGAGSYLEPEISRTPGVTPAPGAPASTPLSDLTARMDAVETQLTWLTGQIEQAGFRQRQIEEQFAKYKTETDAKIAALTAPPAAAVVEVEAPPPAPPVPPPARAVTTPRGGARAPAAAGAAPAGARAPAAAAATATPSPAPATAQATEERKLAVAAIERPTGSDPASDGYAYGFRLWTAKFYPEAQQQLKETVEKYPNSSMASRTQNLLGRAYLDDGKLNSAALAFRDSYEKWPEGDRAADSLAYLGEALIQLKKPTDACKIYQVLEEIYTPLNATLKDMMIKGRARARCAV